MLLGWAEELRLLRWLGLSSAPTICEFGCGPGYIAAHMTREWPGATVLGLDTDEELLTYAAAAAPRAHFVCADAGACPLADASVDFVIARHVLQHLDAPERVVQEAFRVLRPGGTFAAIDVDAAVWGMTSPPLPELDAAGADAPPVAGGRLVGRHLHRLVAAAGFVDVHLDAVVYHSDGVGVDAFRAQLDPGRFQPLADEGQVTRASLDRLRTAHEAFTRAADPFVLMLSLIGSGRKP